MYLIHTFEAIKRDTLFGNNFSITYLAYRHTKHTNFNRYTLESVYIRRKINKLCVYGEFRII